MARYGAQFGPDLTFLPLIGMDVVAVSPPYDHPDITSLLANRVILEALSGIARRRTGRAWDPVQPLLHGR
jgi:agmatinase